MDWVILAVDIVAGPCEQSYELSRLKYGGEFRVQLLLKKNTDP